MNPALRLTAGIAPQVVLSTYALGALGAVLGWALDLPLPMLLGPLLLVGGIAMAGLRPLGSPPAVPQAWRYKLVPVIGVAIGAAVPPDILTQAARWWVTVLALVLYVPAAHALSWLIFHRLGGVDSRTAYFAAMPGGFIEALEMGERAGARMDMLVALQFLRLALCIVLIPFAFALLTGQAVGSGAVAMPGGTAALTLRDALLLLAAAVGGWWVASRLNFPAAVLSGPLLASAALHALCLTQATVPEWAIALTQWVLGTSLGARFGSFTGAGLWLALRLAAVGVAALLSLAGLIALVLSGPVGEPAAVVLLAFAPGGITEMSLVALSLQMSMVYVTLHHLVRIVLAVLVARIGRRLLPG